MKTLKKIALELGIFLYLVVALGFVYSEHKGLICSDIAVTITDDSGNFFVEEQDVVNIVNKEGDQGVGIQLSEIDVRKLESEIVKHPSIANAEVFRRIDGTLQVTVTQRRPIVRVINYNGESYYIDTKAALMPLSSSYTARVPVATGIINVPYSIGNANDVTEVEDDLGREHILADLYRLAKMVDEDPLYHSMIEQFYIDDEGEFYLVPKIGPKKIEFGTLENAEEKFFKLTALYKSGLPMKGWDKYKKINLKFKNQVVCTK